MVNSILGRIIHRSFFLQDLSHAARGIRITYWLLNLMIIFLVCQQNLDSSNISQIGGYFSLDPKIIDAKIGGEALMWQMAVSSVALLVFGYLSDMANRRTLILVSVAISGFSYLAVPMSRTVDQFIIIRSLAGVGIGGAVPVMFSFIGDVFPPRSRAAAAGIFMAVINIGYGNGFVLGSLIGSEASLGWKAPFYVQSITLLAIGMALLFLGKYPERGQSETGKYSGRISPSDLGHIFGNMTNLVFIITCIMATMPMGYIQRFLVDYLAVHHGLSSGEAVLMLLLILSGSLFGDLIGGALGDILRLRHRKYPSLFSAAAVLAGSGIFFLFFNYRLPPEPGWPVLAALVAIGFTAALLIEAPAPISKAIMLNVNVPENRGTVSALIQVTAQLGFGLGASLAALGPRIASFMGFEHTRLFNFKTAVLLWVPVGLSWLIVARTAPRDEKRTERIIRRKARASRE